VKRRKKTVSERPETSTSFVPDAGKKPFSRRREASIIPKGRRIEKPYFARRQKKRGERHFPDKPIFSCCQEEREDHEPNRSGDEEVILVESLGKERERQHLSEGGFAREKRTSSRGEGRAGFTSQNKGADRDFDTLCPQGRTIEQGKRSRMKPSKLGGGCIGVLFNSVKGEIVYGRKVGNKRWFTGRKENASLFVEKNKDIFPGGHGMEGDGLAEGRVLDLS